MLIHKFKWMPDKLESFLDTYSLGDHLSDNACMFLLKLMRNTDPEDGSAWIITQYISDTTTCFPPYELVIRLVWSNLVSIDFEEN